MLFIIGIIIVIVSIVVGYTMHFGSLMLLWQPNELLIILGAGIGSALISNPWYAVKSSITSLKYLFKGTPYNKEQYIELLIFSFNIFRLIKTKGILAIEGHIDNPQSSNIFTQTPSIIENENILNFIRDNLRLLTMNVDQVYQFEEIISKELEMFEHSFQIPSKSYLNLGDALPALGIVAAVLGVIVTMRSILEPPEILGSLIGAALVGTFTGVLFAYGLFLPIGHFLAKYGDSQMRYLECIKFGFLSYLYGNPPTVIVEFNPPTVCENQFQRRFVHLLKRWNIL